MGQDEIAKHVKKMKGFQLMHKEQFRLFFGLLGQGTNPFLSDRIFQMADTDQDQHIQFSEFATIIDIYQHGTVEEKNEFSFSLFDENIDGEINFNDMYRVMKKFMSHWSTLQGLQTSVDKKELLEIFWKIDVDHDGTVTLEEYKTVLR
jgi:Ca2+-binding EF-hand superfamily protein